MSDPRVAGDVPTRPTKAAPATKARKATPGDLTKPAFRSYLVTGGAGFLGQAIVPRLLAAGVRVRVIDTAPIPEQWLGKVEGIVGDIRDAAVVDAAVAGIECVLHG